MKCNLALSLASTFSLELMLWDSFRNLSGFRSSEASWMKKTFMLSGYLCIKSRIPRSCNPLLKWSSGSFRLISTSCIMRVCTAKFLFAVVNWCSQPAEFSKSSTLSSSWFNRSWVEHSLTWFHDITFLNTWKVQHNNCSLINYKDKISYTLV